MTPLLALKFVIDGKTGLSPPTRLLTLHSVNNAGYGPRVSMGIPVID
jgi:hypothetical protein